MADIVDYELKLGEEFFLLQTETNSIHKGVCRLISIKTYKDDEDITVTTIEYLLELSDGDTVLSLEENVYATFADACAALENIVTA